MAAGGEHRSPTLFTHNCTSPTGTLPALTLFPKSLYSLLHIPTREAAVYLLRDASSDRIPCCPVSESAMKTCGPTDVDCDAQHNSINNINGKTLRRISGGRGQLLGKGFWNG